jgi:hypothetical protein
MEYTKGECLDFVSPKYMQTRCPQEAETRFVSASDLATVWLWENVDRNVTHRL